MSTSLETYQKTQAIIGIGNLIQNQRINSSIQNLQASQIEANRLQQEAAQVNIAIHDLQNKQLKVNLDANELQKLNITLQETERKRILLKEEEEARLLSELNEKKDAIYHARVDSEEIAESETNVVEKFFMLNSMLASLMDAKIESKDFSSFEDKKFADDTHKNIYSFLDEVNQNLTDEQSSDVKTITEILYIDEDEKIKPLDSQLKEIQKEIAKLEGLIAKNTKAEKKEKAKIASNKNVKIKEKELDAEFFEKLAHLFFKHRTKKKLMGGIKLDEDNFWIEVSSLEWARTGFGMSEDFLSDEYNSHKEGGAMYSILEITTSCVKEMQVDKKTNTIRSDYTIDDLGKNDYLKRWKSRFHGKLLHKLGYVYDDDYNKIINKRESIKTQIEVEKEVKTLQSKLKPLNSDLEKNKIQEKEITMVIKKYEATIEDEKEIVTVLEQKYPFIHTIVANR